MNPVDKLKADADAAAAEVLRHDTQTSRHALLASVDRDMADQFYTELRKQFAPRQYRRADVCYALCHALALQALDSPAPIAYARAIGQIIEDMTKGLGE